MPRHGDMWRLYELLQHVTYKQGWSFLPEDQEGRLGVTIFREVPDSIPPHEAGTIVSHHEIDMAESDAGILRQVYDGILEAETHEALEWFRVDGEVVFDPHKEA